MYVISLNFLIRAPVKFPPLLRKMITGLSARILELLPMPVSGEVTRPLIPDTDAIPV